MSIWNNKLGLLGGLLLGLSAAVVSETSAQTARPATEAEARAFIFGAFLTQAAPAIMNERVALGPELEQRLSLPSGADGRKVYEALMGLTDNKKIVVRKATPEERTGYALAKDLKEPLYTLQADDIKLLIQYDLAANTIPFVGQLGVAVEKPPAPVTSVLRGSEPPPPPPAPVLPAAAEAPPPVAIVPFVAPPPPPPPPPPVVVEKPKPAVAAVQPRATPAPKPKPVPVAEPMPPKGSRVIAVEPTPAAAPPPLRRTGPCTIKPVMTDQDLVNCGALPR